MQRPNECLDRLLAGGQVTGLSYPGTGSKIYGLIFLAVLVGLAYWFVLSRTRFGFELKATGLSESAAVASGVSVKRMVVYSLLLSGAAAGAGTLISTYLIGVVADRFSFTPILVTASLIPLAAAAFVVSLVRNGPESGHGLLKAI